MPYLIYEANNYKNGHNSATIKAREKGSKFKISKPFVISIVYFLRCENFRYLLYKFGHRFHFSLINLAWTPLDRKIDNC